LGGPRQRRGADSVAQQHRGRSGLLTPVLYYRLAYVSFVMAVVAADAHLWPGISAT
jgi:hypothetical protein